MAAHAHASTTHAMLGARARAAPCVGVKRAHAAASLRFQPTDARRIHRCAVATDAAAGAHNDIRDDASPPPSDAAACNGGLTWPSRTAHCGALRAANVGDVVTLCGWVDKQRDMGGIIFADVRDHTGLCQVVADAHTPPVATAALAAMRNEWVVCVTGTVRARSAPNAKVRTTENETKRSDDACTCRRRIDPSFRLCFFACSPVHIIVWCHAAPHGCD